MRKYTGTFNAFGVKYKRVLDGTAELVGWCVSLVVLLIVLSIIGYFLIAGAWYILNEIFGWGLWSWASSFGIWLVCVILKSFFSNNSE